MGIKSSLRIQSYMNIREVTDKHGAEEDRKEGRAHQPRHMSWPSLQRSRALKSAAGMGKQGVRQGAMQTKPGTVEPLGKALCRWTPGATRKRSSRIRDIDG